MVESPKLLELKLQELGLFKADFIECTAGCQQDSFFGVIQPGRCNSAQTLRAPATTWPMVHALRISQPKNDGR